MDDSTAVAVAGDVQAGVSIVAGALTGTGTRDELESAGANQVLATVLDLLAVVLP